MNRFSLLAALCVLCALSLAAQELDLDADSATHADGAAETTDIWFVELSSPPAADGTSLATLREEKKAFRQAAAKAGLQFQERRSFEVLFNGLSVRLLSGDAAKLSRINGVKAIYPVIRMSAEAVREPEGMEMDTAKSLTGADVAQNALGLTGSGIRVGVIDTGIDLNHTEFGGGCNGTVGAPGCRIAHGYDFVGDAYNSSDPANSTPVPDKDTPDDCAGHGTHVAGIIGADGPRVVGVAPNVTLGAYRVFGCTGTTDSDIMIAAMERALADGMHVVNMSIGSAYQWPQYPTAQAADRLVNKGVVVVTSIGNSGGNGLYSASAPGVGYKVIGAANFLNTDNKFSAFRITPDGRLIAYIDSNSGSVLAPFTGTYPLARTSSSLIGNDGCNAVAPPAGSLTGNVALIRRGTCGFAEKATNAQAAGAVGVVLFDNAATAQPSVSPTINSSITIPVVFIGGNDGAFIHAQLATTPTDISWTNEFKAFPNGAGSGTTASSSSWGLTPDLAIKPNLGAPGSTIVSTYPLEYGGYAALTGTSMASPHVAGAAALVLEARPRTPSQAMDVLLMNSADPRPNNPNFGFIDPVHRQGAGMLDIPGAVNATTLVQPAKLDLGESQAAPFVRTLTIRNSSSTPVTYTFGTQNALATGNNTFTIGLATTVASVSFSAPSVLVPAAGTATVDVTIAPPATTATAQRRLYGGYLVLTPDGGGQLYRVPYGGLVGDYQSMTVLQPTGCVLPALASINLAATQFNCVNLGTTAAPNFVLNGYTKHPTGATFSLLVGDHDRDPATPVVDERPYFLVHADHAVRYLRMEVFDATGTVSMGRLGQFNYLGRNSTANAFFSIVWDGTVTHGRTWSSVPDGTYVIKVSLLKALGDPAEPTHTETWTSPPVTIDRP